MKKVLSIILAMVIVLSLAVVPAFAQTENSDFLYYNKFVEHYIDNEYIEFSYDEVYYHYNEDGEIDWALVCVMTAPIPTMNYAVYDDMVCLLGEMVPFKNAYAVYDVALDKFVDICDMENLGEYEGLAEQLYAQDFLYPIGDADFDKELTIFDATYIQRVLAQICHFNSGDDLTYSHSLRGELKYVSDINRDGVRDILDATAIQRKLAKFENYLAVADPDEA